MFKHLLLPTDGSPLSEDALRKGVQFAKSVDAKVTGLYVMPEFHVFTYRTGMLESTPHAFVADCKAHAAQYLGVVEQMAREAGVECDAASMTSDHPYQAIIHAAEKHGCDLIAMA